VACAHTTGERCYEAEPVKGSKGSCCYSLETRVGAQGSDLGRRTQTRDAEAEGVFFRQALESPATSSASSALSLLQVATIRIPSGLVVLFLLLGCVFFLVVVFCLTQPLDWSQLSSRACGALAVSHAIAEPGSWRAQFQRLGCWWRSDVRELAKHGFFFFFPSQRRVWIPSEVNPLIQTLSPDCNTAPP